MKALEIGKFKLSVPIIQGGMGVGISLSGLASAVANEGGVGVISCAGLGLLYKRQGEDFQQACITGLKEEIDKVRRLTKGVVGVNIMVAMTNYADMVRTAIAKKIDIIFSGAGMPLDLPKFLTKDSVTKLVPIVSSARALRIICEKWKKNYNYLPDAVVVEGPKAGGHLGYKENQIEDVNYALETTIPQVVEEARNIELEHHKHIPVIAAGGIYTGEDIARFVQMGAEGVQLGTRFVTTEECDASPLFKQTYIDAKQEDMEIIKSPVGMPGRAIFNSFIEKVKSGLTQPKVCPFHCIKTCDISKSPYCIMLALYNAFKGNMERGYAFAGANAFRAERISTVKETIASLMDELRIAMQKFKPESV